MNTHHILQMFVEFFAEHWLSGLFLLLTASTVLSLFGVRWWIRRRWKRLLEEEFEEKHELEFAASARPEDERAFSLISPLRKEIWGLPEVELQLSYEALSQRAVHIIRSMAAIYHPEAEFPQYEASLYQLLELIRRVSVRLARLASTRPFSLFGNRRLSEYQRFYQVYRKINESPVLQILRRHPYLQRTARWALNLKNLGNPLYWAGKEISREGYFFMLRWFTLTFVTQVARESMRLYSGRQFLTEKDRDAALVCYRLFALVQQWGGPSSGEWAILVDFVTTQPSLDADTKLRILSSFSRKRLPGDLDAHELQTKYGVRLYREGLKRLLREDPGPSPVKKQLIGRKLADPGNSE